MGSYKMLRMDCSRQERLTKQKIRGESYGYSIHKR